MIKHTFLFFDMNNIIELFLVKIGIISFYYDLVFINVEIILF